MKLESITKKCCIINRSSLAISIHQKDSSIHKEQQWGVSLKAQNWTVQMHDWNVFNHGGIFIKLRYENRTWNRKEENFTSPSLEKCWRKCTLS